MRLKLGNEDGNWFSVDAAIDDPAVVCGISTHASLLEPMEPELLGYRKVTFASYWHRGFHNIVWILQRRVVVALPRQLYPSPRGTVRFCDL